MLCYEHNCKKEDLVSSVMTLLPGDIIATGTPPGSDKIIPGDIVDVKVDKIGSLKNPVVGSD